MQHFIFTFIIFPAVFFDFSNYGVFSKVEFDYGRYLQPEARKYSNKSSLLTNNNVFIEIKCKANYPLVWKFNADDSNWTLQNRSRNEWTDRKFKKSVEETSYSYLAWLNLEYKGPVTIDEKFRCEAVNNKSDALIVTMSRVGCTDSRRALNCVFIDYIYVKDEKNGSNKKEASVIPGSSTIPVPKQRCTATFHVIKMDGGNSTNGYFMKCWIGKETESKLSLYPCHYSAEYCSNSFRTLKNYDDICTQIVEKSANQKIPKGYTEIVFDQLEHSAGTALCSSKDGKLRRAQEFFYSAPQEDLQSQKLHFSINEIEHQDLIWISGIESGYYPSDTLRASCIVMKYGFSYDCVLLLHNHGKIITQRREFREFAVQRYWKKDIMYYLKDLSAGTYTLSCLGAVWNTTEWANKSRTFTIKKPIKPYFLNRFQNVTMHKGKRNELVCDALGEPTPDRFEWKLVENEILLPIQNASIRRNILDLDEMKGHTGREYACIARTRFGDQVEKHFYVPAFEDHIIGTPEESVAQQENGSSSIKVAAVTVFILCLISVGLFLCYKKKSVIQFTSRHSSRFYYWTRRAPHTQELTEDMD